MYFRLRLIIVLLASALTLQAVAVEPAVPLTLQLQTESPVLFADPADNAANKDMLRSFPIIPTTLIATFVNIGTTPLKLDTYLLPDALLQLQVSGPDSAIASVRLDHSRGLILAPQAADYPMIPPGGTWSTRLRFPGVIGDYTFTLHHPGIYRLRLLYSMMHDDRRGSVLIGENPLADGAFHGAVASNEVELHVVASGIPVNGVQLALTCDPASAPECEAFTLTAYLRNMTTEKLVVPAWNLSRPTFNISPGNQHVPPVAEPGAQQSNTPPIPSVSLAPGESHAFPLTGLYCPYLHQSEATPRGRVVIADALGGSFTWEIDGSSSYVQTLSPTTMGADAKQVVAGCDINWNPTAFRRQLMLSKMPEDFRLTLMRVDQPDHGTILLQLHYTLPRKVFADIQDPPQTVRINEKEAVSVIESLAREGVLREALPATEPMTGYLLDIDIAAQQLHWRLPLGADLTTYTRLLQLQGDLPLTAQPLMAQVMASLEEQQQQWQGEAAFANRITTVVPAGTLDDAIKHIAHLAGSPFISLSCANAVATRLLPRVPMRQMTVLDAVKLLAELAKVRARILDNTVTLSADANGMEAQSTTTLQ